MAIARDKFWMVGVKAHQDDVFLLPAVQGTKIPYYYKSRITPAEGAYMLDLPNMLMIPCDFDPPPFSKEVLGYMESFYRIKNVVWGACRKGVYNENDLDFVCELAKNTRRYAVYF